MRTSRASKDTAKILQALSPSTSRQTRSSSNGSLRSFAFNQPTGATDAIPPVKEPPAHSDDDDDDDDDDASSLSSMDTVDMEDILERPLKRRKANPAATSQKAPGKTIAAKTDKNTQKAAKAPPRKVKPSKSPLRMDPPPNWDRVYETVKKMRQDNPTAPVDTMGCAELYWRGSSPRDRRFQTLIALMLSSQTKDTVTAVAMQRLHTELGESKPTPQPSIVKVEDDDDKKASPDFKDSTLTLENILAVSPQRLNELIRAVGFHNNKTKYIKAVAPILQEQYHSDIPSTAEDLMSLPGVGPKMAYLCMSAAWGKHEGIGVDVHVHRITNLFGWHKTKTPEETRMALESWLPREKWHEINKLLVGLGQTVCLPVARRCDECYLSGLGLCKGEIKGLKSKKQDRTAVKKRDRSSSEPGIKIEAGP